VLEIAQDISKSAKRQTLLLPINELLKRNGNKYSIYGRWIEGQRSIS